jgi:asparagine synthase (glutamine-hydrolysing)
VGSNGASKIIKYYDPLETLEKVSSNSKNVDGFITIKNSLLDSIKSHLVSDVPVGVFLSAGLDSATLTGFASQLSQDPLNTVTLQFEELVGTSADEAPLAEEISSLYNTNHVTSTVVGAEFYSELRSMLNAMDQPSIDGANTYFVAREASKLGLKVALSGLGGDEVFGGYSSFRQIPLLVNLLRWVPYGEFAGRLLRRSASPFLTKLISPKYLSLLEYGGNYSGAYLLRRGLFMPWELPAVIDSDMALEGWEKLNFIESTNKQLSKIKHSKARVSALELMWYMRNQLLRDSDWAGMAHSLEIRTPLVDSVFFSELGALSATKLDMAQTLDVPLPKSVLNRPKTGFYLPIREWLTANGLQNYGEGYKGWAKMVYEHFVSRP